MKILIDNGHGAETPGKRSPDGRLREYLHTRRIAAQLAGALKREGLDAVLLTPEAEDISLKTRIARANKICSHLGASNVCLISIHLNASGCGDWKEAHGWEAWTSPGLTDADLLADSLYEAAANTLPSWVPIRKDMTDGDPDKEARFALLTGSHCPACLTENLFQDNRRDAEYLMSAEGLRAIVGLHLDGIRNYTRIISERRKRANE